MKKTFLVLIIFSFCLFSSYSQDSQDDNFSSTVSNKKWKDNFQNRIFYGGNLGLQFGTVTMIDISPMIGYKLTDKLTPGIGFTYQYMNDRDYSDSKFNIYGGRIFLRYYFFEKYFSHAEYEHLSYRTDNYNSRGIEEQIGVDNILIGGGLRERVSDHIWINLTVLWNINESVYSLYSNPIIRGGFLFNL